MITMNGICVYWQTGPMGYGNGQNMIVIRLLMHFEHAREWLDPSVTAVIECYFKLASCIYTMGSLIAIHVYRE